MSSILKINNQLQTDKKLFLDTCTTYGLRFTQHLHFSAFNKYICKQGCNICYLRPYWKPKDIKVTLPKDLSILDYFHNVLVDDLAWVKYKYPDVYKWYLEHASLFDSPSFTNDSFITNGTLLLNEHFDFKKISQITLTLDFITPNTINLVETLASKYSIRQIKILLDKDINTEIYHYLDMFNSMCDFTSVSTLLGTNYSTGNANTSKHHEYLDDVPFMITDSLYYFDNKLFLTLFDATIGNTQYCYPVENFNYYQFLTDIFYIFRKMCTTKITSLDPYLSKTCGVISSLSVNEQWSRLPYFLFDHNFMTSTVRNMFNEYPQYFQRKDINNSIQFFKVSNETHFSK